MQFSEKKKIIKSKKNTTEIDERAFFLYKKDK